MLSFEPQVTTWFGQPGSIARRTSRRVNVTRRCCGTGAPVQRARTRFATSSFSSGLAATVSLTSTLRPFTVTAGRGAPEVLPPSSTRTTGRALAEGRGGRRRLNRYVPATSSHSLSVFRQSLKAGTASLVLCAQSASTPAKVLSFETTRSPSLSPYGLSREGAPARRATQSARYEWISVRSPPGIQCPQSQIQDPTIATRSPFSGQAKRGSASCSRSTWTRPVEGPVPAKLPVCCAGSPPIRSLYRASGSTSKLKSYERWIGGRSSSVGCTARSG